MMQQPQQRYVPPTPVHVPIQAVQSLVPQLATAINDIDTLKAQLSAGNANATFPSWDALLQRYALLLTRVQSLTKYISEPPKSALPTGPSRLGAGAPGTPSGSAFRAEPALAHYLVHPLRPLPSDADALAHDVLFQAINTQILPSVDSSTSAPAPTSESASAPISAATRGMLGLEALRELDDGALARVSDRLRARLGREGERARAMGREIERRAEEYDWAYRPDAEEAGEKDEEEDDDDLFGDDEDEEMDGKKEEEEKLAPNPRAGWAVSDYLAYLDTERVKKAPEPAAS